MRPAAGGGRPELSASPTVAAGGVLRPVCRRAGSDAVPRTAERQSAVSAEQGMHGSPLQLLGHAADMDGKEAAVDTAVVSRETGQRGAV